MKDRPRGPSSEGHLHRDLGHHVAFDNRIDDLDSLNDLPEHRVIPIQTQVVLQIDEPLCVAGIVPTRAHADRASHVGYRPQLVAKILRQSYIFVRARTPSLNHKVVLDAMPAEPIVVAGARQSENPRRHHWRGIAAQPHHKRSAAARRRHRDAQAYFGAERKSNRVRRKVDANWWRTVVAGRASGGFQQRHAHVTLRGIRASHPTLERRACSSSDVCSGRPLERDRGRPHRLRTVGA
jgi:hypothetical protein